MNFAQLTQAFKNGNNSGSLPINGCTFSGATGVMAAGLTAGSAAFALRYPATASKLWALQWMHVHVACLTTFTAPVTAGRSLHLARSTDVSAGASLPSGGNALDFVRNDSRFTAETLPAGRVASTGALTMTGITLDTAAAARLALVQVGASGADYDEIWRFDDPLILIPGQTLAVIAGATFDAVGTWQGTFKGGGCEL